MMRGSMLALLLTVSLFALSCRSTRPATLMTFQAADAEANSGKQVALVGYPRFPSMTTVSDTMLLELHEQADGKGRSINISVPIGSGANQLEKPPKEYKQDDLKMHASDGSLVGPKDRVKVSGELAWSRTDTKDPSKHTVWLAAPLVIEKQ